MSASLILDAKELSRALRQLAPLGDCPIILSPAGVRACAHGDVDVTLFLKPAGAGTACASRLALVRALKGVVGPVEVSSYATGDRAPDTHRVCSATGTVDVPALVAPPWGSSIKPDATWTLPAGMLARIASHVAPYASTEEGRYVLQGVELRGDGHVTATDGHRLATLQLDSLGRPGLSRIIPRNAWLALGSHDGAATVHTSPTRAEIHWPGGVVQSMVVDGPFPAWDRVMPKIDEGDCVVRADVVALRAALEHVAGVKYSYTTKVKSPHAGRGMIEVKHTANALARLEINGTFRIVADCAGQVEGEDWAATVPATHTGPDVRTAFNARFLLDDRGNDRHRRAAFGGLYVPMRVANEPGVHVVMPCRI